MSDRNGPYYGAMLVPKEGYYPQYSKRPEEYQVDALTTFAICASHARQETYTNDNVMGCIKAHAEDLQSVKRIDFDRALTFSILVHLSANEMRYPI